MSMGSFISAGAIVAWLATTNAGLSQVMDPTTWWHTNGPPVVRIITPQDGQALLAGYGVHICAVSMNFTDAVTSVEFFAGNDSLGTVTNQPLWGMYPRFSCLTWSNAAPGAYSLTAVATDLAGLSVTSAPVEITVVTDLPPVVRIVKPRDGAMILGPTNVNISASAFDPDGTVASVAFYEGGNFLDVVTSTPPVFVTNQYGVFPIRQTGYSLTWSNVAPGAYTLTAIATDNDGSMATSAPVAITIVTNLPPLVSLIEPEPGERFLAPANVRLTAIAKDADGSISNVEFFSGSQTLGVITNGVMVTNWEGQVRTFYSLTWSNVVPGSYTLTAVATDNEGARGTSAMVAITVVAPPPPTVRIIYPPEGARFRAHATIPIAAVARYFTNRIASVEFLSGTQALGVKTNLWWPTFLWTNVPAGSYTLSAIATDTAGNSATSAPVHITVTTNSPSGWAPSRLTAE